jgi:hypothetical protein
MGAVLAATVARLEDGTGGRWPAGLTEHDSTFTRRDVVRTWCEQLPAGSAPLAQCQEQEDGQGGPECPVERGDADRQIDRGSGGAGRGNVVAQVQRGARCERESDQAGDRGRGGPDGVASRTERCGAQQCDREEQRRRKRGSSEGQVPGRIPARSHADAVSKR